MASRSETMETERPTRARLWKLGLLAAFVAVLVGLWASGATDVLSFETLRQHRIALQEWVAANYLLAVLAFMAIYALGVAFSVPGAVWMSIAGGFLFGTWLGAVYIIIGATVGAVAIFLLAGTVFRDAWRAKAGRAVARMEKGFRRNAFSYLLVLRLVPVFPFWLVNLVPALLGVRLSTYTVATAIGIIPGALVYASVGNGLDAVFARGGTPDLSIIWSPEILGPLLGLAALALVPVAWRAWKERKADARDGA
ncbi:putative transmembrane protein [Caenispirillum salinarum AK4]|uniref:TVP38/TMEM64 family membrane protein n=1 Tax=Caenispirillum salinarum AK4 TaxID=1238182 RepID=K9GWP3_9PROT|nr:TVP38/TMEM64 family protein [Caenispirillum salinarum]EKV29159.1 putative transmembrane protein [Caenispirillum salinarum AK4]